MSACECVGICFDRLCGISNMWPGVSNDNTGHSQMGQQRPIDWPLVCCLVFNAYIKRHDQCSSIGSNWVLLWSAGKLDTKMVHNAYGRLLANWPLTPFTKICWWQSHNNLNYIQTRRAYIIGPFQWTPNRNRSPNHNCTLHMHMHA